VDRRIRRGVALDSKASSATELISVNVNELTVSASRTRAIGWTVAAILMTAYVVIFAWFSAFSLQDYPNHLARAVAMSDLMFHGGARFGDLFQYHFSAVPYVLGDLVLARAVDLLGVRGATALWIALVMLSLPLALLFYLRGSKLAADGRILIFILSLYLSTDGFLFMGFLTFRLAIALTLVCFALVQRLRRRWSTALFAVYGMVVVLGYLTHLATIVFLATALGVSALLRLWLRSTSFRIEACLFIPIAVVVAWHVGVAVHGHAATDLPQGAFNWGTWSGKIWRLHWEFMRYYGTRFDRRVDELLLLGCAACVLWPVRHQLRRRALMKPAVLEMLLLAAAFVGMYVLLPSAYGDASYLDLRPLALAPLFLIIACLYLPDENSPTYNSRAPAAVTLAVLLATGNLIYLSLHFVKDNAWMTRYRAVVAAVPEGARVLPLYPGTDELRPFMHAASFIVIDRGADIPYLFSGNRGNPQTYFRYIHLPYAPPESWYYEPAPPATDVNWGAVACSYDFLLVMKPFELRRIRLVTTPLIENERASLLAITRQGCTNTGARATPSSPGT
jgi:hypothetical protein